MSELSNAHFIRREAEMKWLDTPGCKIRDLLSGIRNLDESERQERLKVLVSSI